VVLSNIYVQGHLLPVIRSIYTKSERGGTTASSRLSRAQSLSHKKYTKRRPSDSTAHGHSNCRFQKTFEEIYNATVRAALGRLSALIAFSYENPFCMGLLYGRAGRLTAENGGFRPGQSLDIPFYAIAGNHDHGGSS
jgi:hypothetical protein